MIKTITRISNSQGLIFDAALRELTGLRDGDQVNISVHAGGSIITTPVRRAASPEAVAKAIDSTVKGFRHTLEKLA